MERNKVRQISEEHPGVVTHTISSLFASLLQGQAELVLANQWYTYLKFGIPSRLLSCMAPRPVVRLPGTTIWLHNDEALPTHIALFFLPY